MLSGTLLTRFTRAKKLDKHKAKLVKASIYASKNLCYHLDGRHKLSEDGYTKATDTVAWGSKIKEFVEYRPDLLIKELSRYLRTPMCVGFSCISYHLDTFGRLAITRLRRVMSAYTDDRPYSLDLVSAVRSCLRFRPGYGISFVPRNRRNGRERSPTRCMI